jgi:hypothetical protein
LRVVYQEGLPWFHVEDVANILDFMNPTYLMEVLNRDEHKPIAVSEVTYTSYISTKGMYRLFIQDDLWCSETKHFEHWFTENIPKIYAQNNSTDIEDVITITVGEKEFKTTDEKFEDVYDRLLPATVDIENLKKEVKELFKLYY